MLYESQTFQQVLNKFKDSNRELLFLVNYQQNSNFHFWRLVVPPVTESPGSRPSLSKDSYSVSVIQSDPSVFQDKHYLCVMAADTPDQNLTQYFPLCNDFIHAARLRGGNVLIHW